MVTYRGVTHRLPGAVQVVDAINVDGGCWVDEHHIDVLGGDMVQTHLLECAESSGRRRRDGSLYPRHDRPVVRSPVGRMRSPCETSYCCSYHILL